MVPGKLAVVEPWQRAASARRPAELLALSAPDVKIVGPRGAGYGHRLLADWLERAGLRLTPLRWFCGSDDEVVVEQDARWESVETGEPLGRRRVASRFRVRAGVVAEFERHDDLSAALEAAGLGPESEVTRRGGHDDHGRPGR